MLKRTLLLVVAVCLTAISFAQDIKLTHVLSLKLADDNGARGSAVAWHPILKRYYAPKCGNAEFIMNIFDQKGKRISADDLTTQFDVRGFWWSPVKKTFCANGYDNAGWVSYILDAQGIPVGVKHDRSYKTQPGEQSIGAYNPKDNQVYFLEGQTLKVYDASTFEEGADIPLSVAMDNPEDLNLYEENELPEHINSTAVYTGIPKGEIALLDHEHKKIQLYSKSTGKLTKKLILPAEAPTSAYFCFSYANNIYWIFDLETKTWEGYKIGTL